MYPALPKHICEVLYLAPAAFAATLFFFVFVFIIATKSINIHIVVNTYSKIKSQKVIQDI